MQEIITSAIQFVKEKLSGAEGGHDWGHVYRVWNHAKIICVENKNLDSLVVELSALLHDVADHKFRNEEESLAGISSFLATLNMDDTRKNHVMDIINNISYSKNAGTGEKWSPEFLAVSDADRLDAIGAIGIARAFNYGGYSGRPILQPDRQTDLKNPGTGLSQNNAPATISHFHEKLLKLKDSMTTPYGKRIAEERHRFMEEYLKQLFKELNED